MNNHTYISSDADFERYVEAAGQKPEPIVAADIESELNLHVYGERFCLLQVYDGQNAAVVDPHEVSIDKIRAFLEDPGIRKIFYDAASDRTLLYKTHRILLSGVIDLKPAVELLDMRKQGLDSVLSELLGIDPPASKKKYQSYNWTRRPIKQEAVDYALRDVIYLFKLRDELFERLKSAGTFEEYEAENERRQQGTPDINRKPGVMRSRRFQRLPADARELFEALYDIRETYAERLDLPPNTVLSNKSLFALAVGEVRLADFRPNKRVRADMFEDMIREMGQVG